MVLHHPGFHFVRVNTTAPNYLILNEVWGKVIFLHLSVILFTRGGSTWEGTPWQVHPLGRHIPPGLGTPLGPGTPLAGTPPGRYTPLGIYTPWDQIHLPRTRYTPEQCMLGDTGNKRAVRILLECILV